MEAQLVKVWWLSRSEVWWLSCWRCGCSVGGVVVAQLVGDVVAQLSSRCGGSVGLEVWWLIWWRSGGSVGEGVVAQLVWRYGGSVGGGVVAQLDEGCGGSVDLEM